MSLAKATGASRSLIQLAPNADGVCLMLEWDRGDTLPLGYKPPTPVARRVFSSGRALVIDDVGASADAPLVEYLTSVGARSAVAYPVSWQNVVEAVLGFQDSEPRRWRDHALPLLERLEGQIAAALVQARVFEQQQQTVEQLRNLDRMREELIANVSHELRTPLTSIAGFAKTLRRPDLELDESERDRILEVLELETGRLIRFADELLELARFRRGTNALQLKTVPLSEVVERVRRTLSMPDGRRLDVRVESDCSARLDADRMQQVLSNLLVNAVRHGEGTVTLSCATDGADVVVDVTDEGGGVARDYEEEMFEPFSHRSDRSDSTGLGLSIARAIVEAHGGTLTYVASAAGKPHRFSVRLPDAAGDAGRTP